MDNHEHDYRKLNDEAVFCRSCGDIKTVTPPVCTLPHYPVYPYIVPYTPPATPWWQPWPVTTVTCETGTSTAYPETSVSYTSEAVS